jgi:NAD(P)-dependent dehydrogenase (short-subunit alcohol dehydrogenase family)
MDLELRGRIAIVTGGSRGIGKSVARVLAEEGADLALVARRQPLLAATAEEIARATRRRVLPIVADTIDERSVDRMVEQVLTTLGRIDILVNGAAAPGYLTGSPKLSSITNELFQEKMDEKVMGYLRCARAVAPAMIRQGWGRIVNISGLNARLAGNAVASMCNVAVAALTKNLADELGPHGINVTVIHPWAIRTEEWAEVVANRARIAGTTTEEIERRLIDPVTIGRLVEAREVAYVVAFLVSPKAVAINGDAISVGGGYRGPIYY